MQFEGVATLLISELLSTRCVQQGPSCNRSPHLPPDASVVAVKIQAKTDQLQVAFGCVPAYETGTVERDVSARSDPCAKAEGIPPYSESRMREIRPSGSMSGKWKRSTAGTLRHRQPKGSANRYAQPNLARHFSTLQQRTTNNCDGEIYYPDHEYLSRGHRDKL